MDAQYTKIKDHLLLITAGLLSALLYASLSITSKSDGDVGVFQLWLVSGACALLCFFIWNHYRLKQAAIPVLYILLFSILFRALGIGAFPILEDDFYRFLWDGYRFVEHGNPYGIPPAAFFDKAIDPDLETILGQINNPEIATIYGPVNQYLFALSYLIAPGKIWPLQLLFALADIGIILLLFKLAKPNNVLLYAWCPLVIKEFAFTAHPDVIGVVFMIAAWYCGKQSRISTAAILIALAAGAKIFAIIVAPFLLRFNIKAWLIFLATVLLIALPFGINTAWLPDGLKAMSGNWFFNAPLYLLLQQLFSFAGIKIFLTVLFAVLWLYYFYSTVKTKNRYDFRGDWVFGVFFICSSTLNPWYLVWLLPFATVWPSRWAWTASVSVLLAYGIGLNLPADNNEIKLGPYDIPPTILALEFLAIAIALLFDVKAWRKNPRQT